MPMSVIIEPLLPHSFWISDILDGVVKESARKSIDLNIISGDGFSAESLNRIEQSAPVLVIGSQKSWFSAVYSALRAFGVEMLTVSLSPTGLDGCSHASFNTESAAKQLTRLVCGSGRKKPVLFGMHGNTVGDNAKLAGFSAGLKSCAVPLTKERIIYRKSLSENGEQLLAMIDDCDAVICVGDSFAVWVSELLSAHGIKVPDKVLVTGFGNWQSFSRFRPSGCVLPRVFTDLSRLGCEAVHLFQYLQSNPTVKNASVTLECLLEDESRLLSLQAGEAGEPPIFRDFELSSEPMRKYTDDSSLMETLRLESLSRSLDPLDQKIVALLRENHSNNTIAEQLYVSEGTVKYRIRAIVKSGEFESRAALVDQLKAHRDIGFG